MAQHMAQNKSLEELAKEQQQPPAPPEPPEPPAATAAKWTPATAPDPAGKNGEMVIPFRAAGKEMVLFPMVKEAKTPEEVHRNIAQVRILVELLRNPENVLTSIPALSKYYRLWDKAQNEKMLLELQKRTGADMEQLRDPSKRTPEQNECFMQIGIEEETKRVEKFWDSRFWNATTSLTEKIDNAAQGPLRDTRFWNDAILYFFAKHPEIDATEEGTLSEENIAELHGIFDRMEAYYTQSITGKIQECAPENLLAGFIEHEMQPERQKVITKMSSRLLVISDKEYENTLSATLGTQSAGLFCLTPDGTKRPLDPETDTPFIWSLATLVTQSYTARMGGASENEEVVTSVSGFLGELGFNPDRHAARNGVTNISRAETRDAAIHKKMAELDSVWGRLPNGEEHKLIAVLSYYPKTESMGFISPYLNRVLGKMEEKERREINRHPSKPYFPWHCDLLHATAAIERNKAAVEVAKCLLARLQQRGTTPDSKLHKGSKYSKDEKDVITYRITCKGLTEDCPALKMRLQSMPDNSRRTQYLKRTFPAVYKILREKSDLFRNKGCAEPYYTDLKITEIVPTMKTLDTYITITHTGKNPKYKRPFIDMDEFAEESEDAAGKE